MDTSSHSSIFMVEDRITARTASVRGGDTPCIKKEGTQTCMSVSSFNFLLTNNEKKK